MSTVVNSNTVFITHVISDSITRPSNATQYAVGDAISEVTSNDMFAFADVCKPSNFSCLISGATIYSSVNAATKLECDLFLFADNNEPTETADNAAWDPTDAELNTCLGVISFAAADWVAGAASGGNSNAMCDVNNLGLAMKPGRSDLRGQLVARNTYTPTSGEILTIKLKVAQD